MFCITTQLSSGWALNMRHIPDEAPTAGPAADRLGRRKSAVAEDGVPDRGEMVLDLLGVPAVALGRWLDAQRPQQVRRWRAGIAGFPEHRMKALLGQVLKHQVDHAPRVERLSAGCPWLIVGLPAGCLWLIHGITSPVSPDGKGANVTASNGTNDEKTVST
jgi:hypothetical protein